MTENRRRRARAVAMPIGSSRAAAAVLVPSEQTGCKIKDHPIVPPTIPHEPRTLREGGNFGLSISDAATPSNCRTPRRMDASAVRALLSLRAKSGQFGLASDSGHR
jgi:hypothetical protein